MRAGSSNGRGWVRRWGGRRLSACVPRPTSCRYLGKGGRPLRPPFAPQNLNTGTGHTLLLCSLHLGRPVLLVSDRTIVNVVVLDLVGSWGLPPRLTTNAQVLKCEERALRKRKGAAAQNHRPPEVSGVLRSQHSFRVLAWPAADRHDAGSRRTARWCSKSLRSSPSCVGSPAP